MTVASHSSNKELTVQSSLWKAHKRSCSNMLAMCAEKRGTLSHKVHLALCADKQGTLSHKVFTTNSQARRPLIKTSYRQETSSMCKDPSLAFRRAEPTLCVLNNPKGEGPPPEQKEAPAPSTT